MNGEAARERIEVPIACNWAALTAEQQERQRALLGQLTAACVMLDPRRNCLA